MRRAQQRDVPAIVALLRDDELGAAREDATDDEYAAAYAEIDSDPHQLLAVLEVDTVIVGTCQLTFTPGLSRGAATRMTIEAVRIGSGSRGAQLGTAMLRWALDRARENGARLVQLTTDKSRDRAAAFYERLGFVATHDGMKLELD